MLLKKFANSYLFFLLALCVVFNLVKAQLDQIETIHISPANTVFLFDFDDVVVTRETRRIVWGSAAAIIGHPWVLFLLLKPSFYRDIIRSLVRNVYADGTHIWGLYYYLNHFQDAHTFFTQDIKEALLFALNQHKPIAATLKVIWALKESGYKVYVLTNKDRMSLLNYIKPYIKKYHKIDLDMLFDGYYCADHRYQKPNPAIYTWVASALCKDGIEHLIFFDDKQINIEGAQKANTCFKGFHITDPQKLEENKIIHEALMWNNQKSANNQPNKRSVYEPNPSLG